ncbi:DUF4397 domain-containing protein [Thalassobacillus sp. C254]|uniref:DUF4397 domain-containing protein n=1 Tax=Thalassobacillus sp. C254 TaxID=1225341 RepID=UPI0006D19AD9|nr:DUF4397 domain-containing protein [Thalassobacillus sp. C254]
MYPFHPSLVQQCLCYNLMADFYKYRDPRLHIHYYKLHFQCMHQLMAKTQGIPGPSFDHKRRQDQALVRFLHASPGTPAIDVYVNGEQVFDNVSYQILSRYLTFPEGEHEIEIYEAGQTETPVLSGTVSLEEDEHYTFAVGGTLDNLDFYEVTEAQEAPADAAMVRFWHLSPDAPAVDITDEEGEVIFSDVSFGEVTEYAELSPGSYTLEVRSAGTAVPVMTLRNLQFSGGQAYSVTAMGLAEGTPRLETLIIQP